MCEVSPTSTCVPTETAALFRIKEPPKSVLRYGAESRIITLKRKTKLTRIPTIRLPVTQLSSLNFFITHHHPLFFRHFRSTSRTTSSRSSSIFRSSNKSSNFYYSVRYVISRELAVGRSVRELKFYLSSLIIDLISR